VAEPAHAGLAPRPGVMRLTVLGAAAAWSLEPGRASSSYLVQLDGESIVMDMGQGSFSELAAYVEPGSVLAVLISHLHPDHCIDLIPLRLYCKYGRTPATTVDLYAPAGIRERFDALTGEDDYLSCLPGESLQAGTFEVGPFEITAAPVLHVGPSFAFRVAPKGASRPGLVYSGDVGRSEDLVPLLRPGDTLLTEASFGDGPIIEGPNHLDACAAACLARDNGAGRLILTHLLPEVDPVAARESASRFFRGRLLMAEPGLQVDID